MMSHVLIFKECLLVIELCRILPDPKAIVMLEWAKYLKCIPGLEHRLWWLGFLSMTL